MNIIHASDIHLGKTYRNSQGEWERYTDFYTCLSSIVDDAVRGKIDAVLIGGDLFHVGQILPKTFDKTIETLQPLKDAGNSGDIIPNSGGTGARRDPNA